MAFESIDGPPSDVFVRLVTAIRDEADTRQVATVSRAGPADYRVRGYMTASVVREQVSLNWVWDIYDADQRRVQRIGGEETIGGNVQDAWTAADQAVLRRIARSGIERVEAFLKAPQRPAPAEPNRTEVAAASRDAPRLAARQ